MGHWCLQGIQTRHLLGVQIALETLIGLLKPLQVRGWSQPGPYRLYQPTCVFHGGFFAAFTTQGPVFPYFHVSENRVEVFSDFLQSSKPKGVGIQDQNAAGLRSFSHGVQACRAQPVSGQGGLRMWESRCHQLGLFYWFRAHRFGGTNVASFLSKPSFSPKSYIASPPKPCNHWFRATRPTERFRDLRREVRLLRFGEGHARLGGAQAAAHRRQLPPGDARAGS